MPTTFRPTRPHVGSAAGQPTAILALLLILCLTLTGCSLLGGNSDPNPEPTTSAVGDGPVQDTWIYEHVSTVAADGSLVDLTDKLLGGLSGDADAAVVLRDGVTFTPVPALTPRIRDNSTGFRDDLDVVAGIVETDQGRAMQVIATPRGDVSVEADDILELNLSHLGLEPGAPLIVDFAFGQGIPAEAGEEGRTGAVLLAERMADERFQWFAVDGEDGLAPGLQRVFGSAFSQHGGTAATTGPASTFGDGSGDGAGAVVVQAAAFTDSRMNPAADGGGFGGVPLKAQPVTMPINELAGCTSSANKCISDYFEDQTGGANSSAEKLFRENMGGGDGRGGGDPCTGDCGGAVSDPHMLSFDGYPYDLQLLGEFTLATSDAMSVQVRMTPTESSPTTVSVITAAAVNVDGHRVTVRNLRESVIQVDGEPLAMSQALEGFEVGAATAVAFGDALYIEAPNGPRAIIRGLGSSYMNIYVEPGGSDLAWSGLLGSPDRNPDNDLTTRDGTQLALRMPTDELYNVFAESWRIAGADSLFDYGAGESTETFTDRTFPSSHVSFADLTDEQRAVSETVCRLAGIEKTTVLEWCIFDYAMTGSMEFVADLRHAGASLSPPAGEWRHGLRDVKGLGTAWLDNDGHVLMSGSTDDGGRITALDLATGALAWKTETPVKGCLAVTDAGTPLIPTKGEGEGKEISLTVIDPADGAPIASVPTELRGCDSMTVVGDVVLIRSGNKLLGIDVTVPEIRFTLDLDSRMTGPVVSEDGMVWVVLEIDGTITALRIDPADGSSTKVALPVPRVTKYATGTADGFVVAYRGEDHPGGLLRMSPAGVVWQTKLPTTFRGGVEGNTTYAQLATGDGLLTAYVQSGRIGTFDLETGDPLRAFDPSSFSNKGHQLAVVDGLVVVGTIAGSWVEAWDMSHATRTWNRPKPAGHGEVSEIGPITPSGQVIVMGRKIPQEDGVFVALVGPGR